MARTILGLTKLQWRHLARILFAIPVREPGDRWGTWWLYALDLQDGHYYVGITRRASVDYRYMQHVTGKGAKWTQLHPPIRIRWTRKLGHMIESEAVVIETATTLQFIDAYGIDRVRGGRLVSSDPIKHHRQVQKMLGKRRPLSYN